MKKGDVFIGMDRVCILIKESTVKKGMFLIYTINREFPNILTIFWTQYYNIENSKIIGNINLKYISLYQSDDIESSKLGESLIIKQLKQIENDSNV